MNDFVKKLEQTVLNISSHRYDLLEQYSKQLLAADPTNYLGHNNLVRAYYGQQKFDEMWKAIEIGLAAYPEEWCFYNWQYYFYLARGGSDYIKAKQSCEKALQFYPEGAFLYRHLAEIYLINWEPEKALKYLEKAIELDPDNPEYRSRYSIALIRCHKKLEALEVVKKSLTEDPDDRDVLDNAGMVFTLAGELNLAEKLFRDALSRHPTYEYFQKHLAWVQSEQDDKKSREEQGKSYTPLYLRHTGRKRFFDEDAKTQA